MNKDLQNSLLGQIQEYIQTKKYDLAENQLKLVIKMFPKNYDAIRALGVVLALQSKHKESLSAFEKLIRIQPNDFMAWMNKGNVLRLQYKFEEALYCYNKSIAINPFYPESINNRGILFQMLGKVGDAIADHSKVTSLDPLNAEGFNNLGNAYKSNREFTAALNSYYSALSINPNYATAKWNLSLLQLLLGDYKEGLSNYEFRWQRDGAEFYRHSSIPQLTNLQQISNKKILIWSEQGFGDTIHFCRFIPLLYKYCKNLFFEVQPPLVNLLSKQFPFPVSSNFSNEKNLNYQLPLCSLPLLFNNIVTLSTQPKPYIQIESQKVEYWGRKLPPKINRFIGISCSGNYSYDALHGNTRPIPLFMLLSILHQFKDIKIFIIQKELRKSDVGALEHFPDTVFLGNELIDFEDSAAIIQNMDHIISIDTSLAHLSGAMGKSTSVLLPWVPDWRWSSDLSSSTNLYPNMVLFRQNYFNDWSSVLNSLQLFLKKTF